MKQDFILLILNCKKYEKKAKFQKLTWLKSLPLYLKYYHIVGDEDLECEYKFDNTNNVLWIRVKDDYNSLPKKVIRAYKAINENFDYKYIFKTDDDQVLVNTKFFDILINLINSKTPKTHYGGFIPNIKHPHICEYNKIHPELPSNILIQKIKYCTGRFYFLSMQAIQYLILKSNNIEKEYLEDYAIGLYLDNFFKRDILHIKTNMYFTDIEHSDYDKWIAEGKL